MTSIDYAFDDTSIKVKSSIISLTISDDQGNDLHLKDLKSPVVVRFQNSEEKVLDPILVEYQQDTVEPISPMYYHQINVNETGVSLAVVVTPLDGTGGYQYFLSVGQLPNASSSDANGRIPKGLYSDERDWTIFFDTIPYTDVMNENGTIYLGLIPDSKVQSSWYQQLTK